MIIIVSCDGVRVLLTRCVSFGLFSLFPSVPGPVAGVSATALSPSNVNISWTPPKNLRTVISQYIVSYFSITCPLDQSQNPLDVSQSSTSMQLTLQSGQVYNISVKASNALGESAAVSVSYSESSHEGK